MAVYIPLARDELARAPRTLSCLKDLDFQAWEHLDSLDSDPRGCWQGLLRLGRPRAGTQTGGKAAGMGMARTAGWAGWSLGKQARRLLFTISVVRLVAITPAYHHLV